VETRGETRKGLSSTEHKSRKEELSLHEQILTLHNNEKYNMMMAPRGSVPKVKAHYVPSTKTLKKKLNFNTTEHQFWPAIKNLNSNSMGSISNGTASVER